MNVSMCLNFYVQEMPPTQATHKKSLYHVLHSTLDTYNLHGLDWRDSGKKTGAESGIPLPSYDIERIIAAVHGPTGAVHYF